MNNSQLPAAPLHNDELVKAFIEVEQVSPNGLTKREHFAGLVMQGLLANSALCVTHNKGIIDWLSTHAVLQADELLKELAK